MAKWCSVRLKKLSEYEDRQREKRYPLFEQKLVGDL